MRCVVDCSVALAWALPDEASNRATRLLERLAPGDELWVPALWWYELANGLTVAERRRRVAAADVTRLGELYGSLPIRTDADHSVALAARLIAIAHAHGLSGYDAAYLELALRRKLPLATADERLARAARAAGAAAV